MKNQRVEKIRILLLKEVSNYLKFEMNLPNIQVTKVLLSSDLRKSKIFFVDVLGKIDEANFLEQQLNSNSNKIRRDLFRRLSLKIVPELIFEYDRGYYL